MPFYELWFDGGIKSRTKGNPYGSFEVDIDTTPQGINRWIKEELVITSNHAEYLALEYALDCFADKYVLKKGDHLTLVGDSELVRNQIGTYNPETTFWESWKCNYTDFQIIRSYIRQYLESFIIHDGAVVNYKHVPRKKIVERFGH